MNRSRTVLAYALIATCSVLGCGGASLDGGQSGTGLSAIRGNVVAITGAGPEVGDIRVSLAATNLATQTDASGRFDLRGKASGAAELVFERARDGLFASTEVVIPAGGVLELQQIVIDSDSGEVHPAQQRVEFQGIIETLDCSGGTIRITPKDDDDQQATVFTVEVASATIRDDGAVLACGDLQIGDRLQVEAETADGSTLVNAELELEGGEDGPGDTQHVELEAVVEAVDCAGGTIRITPKDDDPQATVFTVQVASATIRDDDAVLACGDLQVGDRLQVEAETSDGSTLVNAELELEAGEDGPGDGPGDQGTAAGVEHGPSDTRTSRLPQQMLGTSGISAFVRCS